MKIKGILCDNILGDCFETPEEKGSDTDCIIHKIINDKLKQEQEQKQKLKYCVCLVINNTLLNEKQEIINPLVKIPYIDLSLLKKELKRIERIIQTKDKDNYYKSLFFRKK